MPHTHIYIYGEGSKTWCLNRLMPSHSEGSYTMCILLHDTWLYIGTCVSDSHQQTALLVSVMNTSWWTGEHFTSKIQLAQRGRVPEKFFLDFIAIELLKPWVLVPLVNVEHLPLVIGLRGCREFVPRFGPELLLLPSWGAWRIAHWACITNRIFA